MYVNCTVFFDIMAFSHTIQERKYVGQLNHVIVVGKTCSVSFHLPPLHSAITQSRYFFKKIIFKFFSTPCKFECCTTFYIRPTKIFSINPFSYSHLHLRRILPSGSRITYTVGTPSLRSSST